MCGVSAGWYKQHPSEFTFNFDSKVFALAAEDKQALLIALLRHLIREKTDEFSTTPGRGALLKAAVASVSAMKLDLAAAFTQDEGFWKTHTKARIESLLRKATSPEGTTFADWYSQQEAQSATDTQAFERLLKGKVADLIAALTKTAFDFSAWVPTVITRRWSLHRSTR